MRVLIQRVRRAAVEIGGERHSSIGRGLLVLLGIGPEDGPADVEWLVRKVAGLRIFDDAQGVMNLDVRQIGGEVMVVSQFTLMASAKNGNRPSYVGAAGGDVAIPLYEEFIVRMSEALGRDVSTGIFGADMDIELVNDGPVTIWLDSRE